MHGVYIGDVSDGLEDHGVEDIGSHDEAATFPIAV